MNLYIKLNKLKGPVLIKNLKDTINEPNFVLK